MRRTLTEDSGEYKRLSEHFVRTGAAPSRDRFGSSTRNSQKALEVLRLERLFLPELEAHYRRCMRDILKTRGANCGEVPDCDALRSEDSFGLNEVFLYHGCQMNSVDAIIQHGFDPSRGGERSGRFFGRGTYFADAATKADTFADSVDGQKCLIVAQVCLGKVLFAMQAMPGLENLPVGADSGEPAFDSVLGENATHGGALDHREYIVYRSGQILPRYLLWYWHTKACRCFRCNNTMKWDNIALSLPPLRIQQPLMASDLACQLSNANEEIDEAGSERANTMDKTTITRQADAPKEPTSCHGPDVDNFACAGHESWAAAAAATAAAVAKKRCNNRSERSLTPNPKPFERRSANSLSTIKNTERLPQCNIPVPKIDPRCLRTAAAHTQLGQWHKT